MGPDTRPDDLPSEELQPPDAGDAGSTLRLDDQLCFAVCSAANAVVRAYRPLLGSIGVTHPQYLVLMALWEQDGVSLSRLAARRRSTGSGGPWTSSPPTCPARVVEPSRQRRRRVARRRS